MPLKPILGLASHPATTMPTPIPATVLDCFVGIRHNVRRWRSRSAGHSVGLDLNPGVPGYSSATHRQGAAANGAHDTEEGALTLILVVSR